MMEQPYATRQQPVTEPSWDEVREMFSFDRSFIQLGTSQFIASHPRPVTEAIEYYRKKLDEQPVLFTQQHEDSKAERVRQICAEYMGITEPDNIALTGSTSAGLSMIYNGLSLEPGDEILATEHDHYSHHESIRQVCARTGASFRKIPLYREIGQVTKEEIIGSITNAVQDETKIVSITWVHSSTGLRLPVREICTAISEINSARNDQERIRVVLDAVHGFGVETESFPEIGCDFFITGCHKWLYGPRGTGFVAATTPAWQEVTPVIPSFSEVMDLVIEGQSRPRKMDGKQMTPGGFHAFEHRWALYDAFNLMLSLGKKNICDRVHYLNRLCKQGLSTMPHVMLHTPMADAMSSGIISFGIKGYKTADAVEKLLRYKLIATAAPYKTSYVRFTPGIINTEEEINRALEIVDTLK